MSETQTPKQGDLWLFKRVFAYIRQDRAWFWLVFLLTPIGVLAEVLQPVLLQRGIDDYISVKDLDGLASLAMMYGGTVLIAWLSSSLGYYSLQRVSLRGLARLRSAIYDHVMSQGGRFFDERHAGSLMTRTINDVDAVYESLARGAIQLLTNFLTIAGMLISMFLMDAKLTLVAFLFSPVIWLIVSFFRSALRPISLEIRETLSRLNGYFAERVFGMSVVQLYGAEKVSQKTFDEMSKTYMQANHKSNWLDAGLFAVMDGMASVATAAVVWFAATQFLPEGQTAVSGVQIGILVAFIDYLGRIFVPIRELSGQIATLQRSFAALEKIFGLLDTHQAIAEGDKDLPQPVRGEVQLSQVRFSYAPQLPEVLKGIDLHVNPGEVVAIVGSTGSGKSTIGRLLTRMYDGYQGEIRIDGQNLADLKTASVRDAITVVHQDAWLMEGSVRDNVRLGDERISDEDLELAAERSRASELIAELPGGWDAILTERGRNISTGQRQLLSIARALARKAPIVILDEATASVDSMTEKQIDIAMEALFKERTVLVIAHRLQTIRKADRIVVLHRGEIAETGTHEALMAQKGRYAALVESGFSI